MNDLAKIVGTVGGVGYLRPAPGTWGSLIALPLGWGIHVIGGFSALLIASLALFYLGWWATKVMTRGQADHDPSEIVVDEVVGQWIALLPLSYGAARMGVDITALWPGWITAFVMFRLFDITKPGPIGWADRRDDAFGVMLDDVIAGVFAALCVLGMAAVAHGIFAV